MIDFARQPAQNPSRPFSRWLYQSVIVGATIASALAADDALAKGVNVITLAGQGNNQQVYSSGSANSNACSPGSFVVITTTIAGGQTGNTIAGTAKCGSANVGTAKSDDPGNGQPDADQANVQQATGAPQCANAYSGAVGDRASFWTVTCVFH